MFYLKELFLIIRDHKALALANLIFLSLFASGMQFDSEIRNFFSIDSKASTSPYFNALVGAGNNADYIARKMRNLPGVETVEVKKTDKLVKEVGDFLKEVGGEGELLGASYNAFKVTLERGTGNQSKSLIREYFSRLAGNKDVTFSKIKNPKPAQFKNSPLYGLFAKWSDFYIAGLAAFGWLFTLWLLSQPMSSQSFVIERFQRKEKTALKMFLWLWAIPVGVLGAAALGAGFSLSPGAFFSCAALLATGSILFLKKGGPPKRFI